MALELSDRVDHTQIQGPCCFSGNLIYKKEKKLEELDRNIRTTHIQLEFCIETFDPNAKKHSDAKKQLYMVRAQTEEELAMLKVSPGALYRFSEVRSLTYRTPYAFPFCPHRRSSPRHRRSSSPPRRHWWLPALTSSTLLTSRTKKS